VLNIQSFANNNLPQIRNSEIVNNSFVFDTIKTPAGFYFGMTDSQILGYIKKNPNIFFFDEKDRSSCLFTKICGKTYKIYIFLYKGKLSNISFIELNGYKDIDDMNFQNHYKEMFQLLKGLNKYFKIRDAYKTYLDLFSVDTSRKEFDPHWPHSYDPSGISMASFYLNDSLDDFFTLFIFKDKQDLTYHLEIGYTDLTVESDYSKNHELFFPNR
jgi:hypothetical protein